MRNSTTFATASLSLVGGGLWVGIEGSAFLLLCAAIVFAVFMLAQQLPGSQELSCVQGWTCHSYLVFPSGREFEPPALKIARELNPKWEVDMEFCNELLRK
jgi:hypothetical protein